MTKPWKLLAAPSLALLVAGCATTPPLALQTVGPMSGGRLSSATAEGVLQVFSSTQARLTGGITYYPHTPYLIYTPGDKKLKSVQNHAGETDQKPMKVPLKPGKYLVYAMADGFGQITVPVLILSGRLTVVFLEWEGMPPMYRQGIPESEFVRTPDGRIVGRRADESEPKP